MKIIQSSDFTYFSKNCALIVASAMSVFSVALCNDEAPILGVDLVALVGGPSLDFSEEDSNEDKLEPHFRLTGFLVIPLFALDCDMTIGLGPIAGTPNTLLFGIVPGVLIGTLTVAFLCLFLFLLS